jgi:environmental stress-induced protein Ves
MQSVLRFSDQPVTAWLNGGGTTRQVAIDPPGATLASGFRWRVSRAKVDVDGPFSRLPGVDRSLWLARGNGLRLDVDGREVILDRPWLPVHFAGEAVVMARLLDGPVEDVNIMVQRDLVRATAKIVLLAPDATEVLPEAPQRLIVVLEGEVHASRGTLLSAGDALGLDDVYDVTITAGRAPARLLVASFEN